jgi:hypothetical protein
MRCNRQDHFQVYTLTARNMTTMRHISLNGFGVICFCDLCPILFSFGEEVWTAILAKTQHDSKWVRKTLGLLTQS